MVVLLEFILHLKELLGGHPMFAMGLLLMAGYMIGKLAGMLHLPEITGYILAGLLVGESGLGVFPSHMHESFKLVTEVAIGLIALTIGAEFSLGKLRRIGRSAFVITLVQIMTTFGAVTITLYLLGMELPFALLLGAVATATEPATVLAEAQSLRARGRFIDYLYSVVALDDAGCVILFGVIFTFAARLLGGTGTELNGSMEVLKSLAEVGLSLLIGFLAGWVLHRMTFNKQGQNEILIIALSVSFLTTAAAIVFHLSPLLTNMTLGATLVNLSARNHRLFRALEPLTPPLYALFFVIAGTELNLDVILMPSVLVLGSGYILARAVGKYGGVWSGCLIARVGNPVRRYLGWCMMSQASVAIGLVLLIQASPVMSDLAPEQAELIQNMVSIVLLSVFFNELIGPPMTKHSIIRGNEMEGH